jgi:hypothetical protein
MLRHSNIRWQGRASGFEMAMRVAVVKQEASTVWERLQK